MIPLKSYKKLPKHTSRNLYQLNVPQKQRSQWTPSKCLRCETWLLPVRSVPNISQPAPTYEEAHNNLTRDEIEKFVIDDKKLARSSGLFILLANGTLRQASSRNLVIEYCEFYFAVCCRSVLSVPGAVKRDILLEFSYALFERNSKSFQWVGYNCVEGLSTTTAQGICNIALGSIKLLPNRNTETGHSFKVYQVWGLNLPSCARLMCFSPWKHSPKLVAKQLEIWKGSNWRNDISNRRCVVYLTLIRDYRK